MSKRKCAFTNREATTKGQVIPKGYVSEQDELHNWTNKIPCNASYSEGRKDRLPSELEMLANEYFHLLELAKLRVRLYEAKLLEVQRKINKENSKKERESSRKKKVVTKEAHVKKILKEAEEDMEKILDKSIDNLWG